MLFYKALATLRIASTINVDGIELETRLGHHAVGGGRNQQWAP